MIGKRLKVNDFEFKYGEETVFVNVIGTFKYKKNGNKYVVYCYDDNKLCYGSAFIRDKELVIMLSKNDKEDIVYEFINGLLEKNISSDYEVISLDKTDSVQIIDEGVISKKFDVNKLYDLTMPKVKVKEEVVTTKKKSISISSIFFMLFILVLGAFFFFNPEVIIGKDKNYVCTKEYNLKDLSAGFKEEVNITFKGNGKLKSGSVNTDYVFNSISNYKDFKDEGKFYKYMKEGDTYKFVDSDNIFRVISRVDNLEEYFSFDEEDDLIQFYENNKYECKMVEVE